MATVVQIKLMATLTCQAVQGKGQPAVAKGNTPEACHMRAGAKHHAGWFMN